MKKDFGIYFWIHFLLLIPIYLSPVIFDWQIVILGAILLQIQYRVLGGCLLTHLEMGKDKDRTFIWYYLHKIFPKLNPKRVKFTIRVIFPILFSTTTIILQNQFNFKPLISFWN
jgi:hypothetical protein